MFRLVDGLPPNVIAIEAVGKVTHDDYRNILIPRAEAMTARGPTKMLYIIGNEFTGFEPEALWDDGVFGFKHWRDFNRIAVVTDHAWLCAAIGMFKPFFPAEVRLFSLAEITAAKDWITDAKEAAA
jgi:hypothetical protein